MSVRFLIAACSSVLLWAGLVSHVGAEPPACCEACKGSQPEIMMQVLVFQMAHDRAKDCLPGACGTNSAHGKSACCDCPEPSGCSMCKWTKACSLTEQQLAKLQTAMRTYPRFSVECMPRIKVCNGQSGQFCISQEQHFVTEVVVNKVRDQVMFTPHNKAFPTGCTMTLLPQVSSDGQSVHLNVKAQLTCLETVSMTPITTSITPILEGGAVGAPVPFTQYIQQPKFVTLTGFQSVDTPDGRTVLFSGWQIVRSSEEQSAVPVLCDLPYVGDLFRTTTTRPETMDVLVLVTPKIMRPEVQTERIAAKDLPVLTRVAHAEEEQEADCLPGCCDEALIEPAPALPAQPVGSCPSCCQGQLACYLEQYEKACAGGQAAEAARLAVQALALDPMCFSKTRASGPSK
jgi:hypothetical protein